MSEQEDSYLDLLEEDLADKEEQIETLEAELVRLRAQLAAVPLGALRRQYLTGYAINESSSSDYREIEAWLRSLEPQP